jgi:hypothetical protein
LLVEDCDETSVQVWESKATAKTMTASKSKRDAAFDGLRKASYATESNKPEDIVACLVKRAALDRWHKHSS